MAHHTQRDHLLRMFARFDTDGNGYLDRRELRAILTRMAGAPSGATTAATAAVGR